MRRRAVEWPTLAVAASIAAGFVAVLAWHRQVPAALVVVALAVLGAWYNSFQHEVVHGHPTRWRAVNTALAVLPLGLVVPFGAYREVHLLHHRTAGLTDPDADPESFYVSADTWARLGPVSRGAVIVLRTLAGRMLLGPPVAAVRWWAGLAGDAMTPRVAGRLLAHVAGVAGVLAVVRMAGVPIWIYVIGVAWGGGSLSLLRSFAEHRFVEGANRSAMVRSGPFLSLLFLNNNLHTTHHARPAASWYSLPVLSERLGSDHIAAAGAGLYRGYGAIARHYLLRPFDQPVGPGRQPITVPDVADGWRRREKAPRLI
ncbi:MAG: fatty acid desaturase [Actinomycetota bacterium]|nr:fatty acid desaturase [Actinomycetota bacterium]